MNNRWAELRQSMRVPASYVAVFGVLFVLSIVLSFLHPMDSTVHGDGYYTYLWTRSLVFDGDLDLKNDLELCGDPWNLAHKTEGHPTNYWNVGPSVFWAPILVGARVFTDARHHPDPHIRHGCKGPMAESAVHGSLIVGFLTMLLGFYFARRYLGNGPALFGAVSGAWLGSLAYYTMFLVSYGHTASAFASGLLIFLWDRYRHALTTQKWLLLGSALGLAALMRCQNAFLVVLPFATWLRVFFSSTRLRDWRHALRHVANGVGFAVAAFLVFFPQLLGWYQTTGNWLFVPQGEHFMRWTSPRIMGVLFSSGTGLFPGAPIIYVAIAGWGLLLMRKDLRSLGIAMFTLLALDTYVIACAWDWWGAAGFPGRRFDALTLPWMFGLAVVGSYVTRLNQRHPNFGLALAASLFVLMGGVWSWGIEQGLVRAMPTFMARSSNVQWKETFKHIVDPFWNVFGNPLTYPASLTVALRYGIHPKRWDVLGAQEFFYYDFESRALQENTTILDFVDVQHRYYLTGSFQEEPARWKRTEVLVAAPGSARILLPIHTAQVRYFDFIVVPMDDGKSRTAPEMASPPTRLSLNVNGVSYGTKLLAPSGLQHVRFTLPHGAIHDRINELWLYIQGDSLGFSQLHMQHGS